jgi:hypothetical protein
MAVACYDEYNGLSMIIDNPSTESGSRIGVLWPGDPSAGIRVTPDACRLHRVIGALAASGVAPEPVVYADEVAERVRERLLELDGVLVWVNPIEHGRDRSALDAMLRDVAEAGVPVSAHPDVILKMGTKQVLYDTRSVGWGCDTHVYRSIDELRGQLPARLAEGQARVLKQHRGNGADGVWKVQLARATSKPGPEAVVHARHAFRGAVEEEMTLANLIERCEPYFERSGRIIDQAYQDRLTEGMVRCYLVHDKVVGFGHQAINALFPAPIGAPPTEAPQPGQRLYSGPTDPRFQLLKRMLETEWVPTMQRLLNIDTASLPVIWDADFLYGPKTEIGEDTYVLCEINVSCVFPFPDDALVPLAQAATRLARSARMQG